MEGILKRADLVYLHFTMIKRFLADNEKAKKRRPHIYIGVFCNSGTHRSVALTQLLGCTSQLFQFYVALPLNLLSSTCLYFFLVSALLRYTSFLVELS